MVGVNGRRPLPIRVVASTPPPAAATHLQRTVLCCALLDYCAHWSVFWLAYPRPHTTVAQCPVLDGGLGRWGRSD